MKKGILFVALMLASIGMSAQSTLKAQSLYDVNQDDKVSISDVNTVVKKVVENASTDKTVVDTKALLEVLNALNDRIASLEEKVAKSSIVIDRIRSNMEIAELDPNLLSGKFSVSATKKVQFTRSNLYWDGSAYHFEANQTDYPTNYVASHVSHFYWTSLADYQSGNAAYMPYAETYSYSSQLASDKFWCGEDNPLTVEGTSGLYALSGTEWYYLIRDRTNASNLYKNGVTVTNGETSYNNCLIIAPDDFTGTLLSSYTLDEVNAAGLVCLPAAGQGSAFSDVGSNGRYWSATPRPNDDPGYAYGLIFNSSDLTPSILGLRSNSKILRLVRNL